MRRGISSFQLWGKIYCNRIMPNSEGIPASWWESSAVCTRRSRGGNEKIAPHTLARSSLLRRAGVGSSDELVDRVPAATVAKPHAHRVPTEGRLPIQLTPILL